jgi:outer membrane biosynthesis protein TonB
MSLFELFFSQGIVAVSLVAALVPLLIAAGLFLAPRLRRWNAERAASRAAMLAERAMMAQAEAEARMRMAEADETESEEEAEEEAPRRAGRRPAEDEAPRKAKPSAKAAEPASKAAPAAAPAPSPTPKPAAPAPEAAATTTPAGSGDPAVPSGIQDLLSSVFADDGHSERYAALLEGLEPVNIQALAELAQQVAGQLQGEGKV